MNAGMRFWVLAGTVGAIEMAGLSIGAPRVQALIEGTGARATMRTGRQAADIAWANATRAATSLAVPVLSQAIRSATTMLSFVDRTTPETVVVVRRIDPRCDRAVIRRAVQARFQGVRRIHLVRMGETL